MANTKIEWTESVWNPVVGCSRVSRGCNHCYAERMARRLAAMAVAARERGDDPGRAANYGKALSRRGRWNGTITLDRGALEEPRSWRQPRIVFVNSMSDLFHKNVPLDFIKEMFAVMNKCAAHTFQVLTKRAERLAEVSSELQWTPNIWMGVSVEDEDTASRVDHLRITGSKTRFLSCEPLLGPLTKLDLTGIHWVIVGGESGPGARPMKEEWVQDIKKKCHAASVPFFFKQWGGVNKKKAGRALDGRVYGEMPALAASNPFL